MSRTLVFFLNGKRIEIDDPPVQLLLVDYLRSPEIGLNGCKKSCGQGGCGACTVILSKWDARKEKIEHRAINSCLRPVCSLAGMHVTTIEGTGTLQRPRLLYPSHSTTSSRTAAPSATEAAITVSSFPPPPKANGKESWSEHGVVSHPMHKVLFDADAVGSSVQGGINPIALRLAANNGTQCGYCSTGFVMNMSEFLLNRPSASKQAIEAGLDGNLCRCTGYRPILTAMKTFAADWSEDDESGRMQCKENFVLAAQENAGLALPFPEEAKIATAPLQVNGNGQRWLTPATISDIIESLAPEQGKRVHFVHGNTGYGIYPEDYRNAGLLIDVRSISDLSLSPRIENGIFRVGAGVSYGDLLAWLDDFLPAAVAPQGERLAAIHYMAARTAGRIVRNTASLGGNTMLVLKHLGADTGEPFLSDLFTALYALEARVRYIEITDQSIAQPHARAIGDLVEQVMADPAMAHRILLLAYEIDCGGETEFVLSQKVARREVNAHSIVNATTRIQVSNAHEVERVILTFGGIAPCPWRARKTEAAMTGNRLALNDLPGLMRILVQEIREHRAHWAGRRKELPWSGISEEFRGQLACAFVYKAVVSALQKSRADLPRSVESREGGWGVSSGRQTFVRSPAIQPVGDPYIKKEALHQTAGQTIYTHDLPFPQRTLHAAVVQSRRALACYKFTVPEKGEKGPWPDPAPVQKYLAAKFPGFVRLITDRDVPPEGNNRQGIGGDQPLFAEGRVLYFGQCIALVLARTESEAGQIADFVSRDCIEYGPIDWPEAWQAPVLGIHDAIARQSIFPDLPTTAPWYSHVWQITRPGSSFDWVPSEKQVVNSAPQRDRKRTGRWGVVVPGSQTVGSQIHFYMETQACIVEPGDEWHLVVRCSTQSPMEIHQTIARALGVEYHRIDVQVPAVGGGFGGKTEQTRFVAGVAAVAAHASGCPVRLVLSRDEDTALIGKRHAFHGEYQIAVDSGETEPEQKGIIRGLDLKMWADGGAYYDCSFIVTDAAQLRVDNAYRIQNFRSQIDVCRTNTAPNTACRGFGAIQSIMILESAMDDVACRLQMTPEQLRELNLYERGDSTPFGQALTHCYIREVWHFLKSTCDYESKKAAGAEFNAAHKWRKRGLSMIPVKYGSGFNLAMLEQASAFVSINHGDGSVTIHQGGVEMGQGLKTQVQQIAAQVLNIPMELIYVDNPKTSITPNPTTTGASTGTTYSGQAVKQSCIELRARLMEFGYEMLRQHGPDWCHGQGIDFWSYGESGWSVRPAKSKGVGPPSDSTLAKLIWQNLVELAYANRVNLLACCTTKMEGGTVPVPCVTYKQIKDQPEIPGTEHLSGSHRVTGTVDSFVGFTYSAACSVVEVDVLTGEVKILSSDIVYDKGWSLNPAIDIGQVEGAFVQGIGYLLTEELVFEPNGPEQGRLNTLNTWQYKPPAASSIPLAFNVHLFPRDSVDIPKEQSDFLNSKEVGEPPLVLAATVFFAVKAAIRASRVERGLSGMFRLDAPATIQEVRRACEISNDDYGDSTLLTALETGEFVKK